MKAEMKYFSFFELATLLEMTARSPDFTNLISPQCLFKYVKLHVHIVWRTILHNGNVRGRVSLRNWSILIDTQNGEPLLTIHETKELTDFLIVTDENLENI